MDFLTLAQPVPAPAAPAATGPGGMFWSLIVPMGFLFGVFYFLLIRPQKKQEKARKAMLKDLKKNDKVVTIGGIHGVVANVREKDVVLKLDQAGNVRMRFARSAISRIVTADEDDESK